MQIATYSVILLMSGVVSGFVALYIWYRKHGHLNVILGLLMLAITAWTLTSAAESLVADLGSKIVFSISSYLSIVSIPLLFLLTIAKYTQYDDWINKKNVILLSIIPFTTFVLTATNSFHRLIWSNVYIQQDNLGLYAVYEKGIFFWVHMFYSYILIFAGVVLLLRAIFKFPNFFSRQTKFLFAASLLPMIANVVYVFSPALFNWMDITPISFVISTILLSLAIFNSKLLESIPLTREKIMDNIDDSIMLLDLQNRIIEINLPAKKIFEISNKEIGKPIYDIFKYWPTILKAINIKEKKSLNEFQLDKTRKIYLELKVLPITDSKNNIIYKMLIFKNITERKRIEEKLRQLSFYDGLTELYNRSFFEEEVRRLNKERQLPISVIVADVNGLKLVNDSFGHHFGDELLKMTAKVLKRSCRSEDIIARWGGDEFVILLPKTPKKQAEEVTKRIIDECKKITDFKIPLSISLGSSTKTNKEVEINRVIAEAEAEMYKNKMLGSKKIHSSFIQTFLKTLQDSSLETEEHIQLVHEISSLLGAELELSEDGLDKLRLAAKLHDIGIVAMDEHLIKKTDRLDKYEWEVIKRHSEIGYRIASSSTVLSTISEYILSHHEWYNGNGYPRGLKGTDIPLIARIISVADAYSVMILGKNHKEKISINEAVEELKKFSGIQFDPLIVEKLIEILERRGDLAVI